MSYLEDGPVPKPFEIGFGCAFVGYYPIVPVKKASGEETGETVSENFKGSGVRLKDATKTKKRSIWDIKDKSISSSGTASSLGDIIQIDEIGLAVIDFFTHLQNKVSICFYP
jgi:hypothetical protein